MGDMAEHDFAKDLSPHKYYRVHLVSALDPQLFFLRLQGGPPRVCHLQAGLLGAFPTQLEAAEPFLELQWSSAHAWSEVSVGVFRKVIREAEEVYFKPVQLMGKEFSLIDNVRCIFGQLYTFKDNEYSNIMKNLSSRGLAYTSKSRFRRYLQSGTVFIKCTVNDVQVMRHILQNDRSESQPATRPSEKDPDFERSMKNFRSEVAQNRKSLEEYYRSLSLSSGEIKRMMQRMEDEWKQCALDIEEERLGRSKRILGPPARKTISNDAKSSISVSRSILLAYKQALVDLSKDSESSVSENTITEIKPPSSTRVAAETPCPKLVSYVPAGSNLNQMKPPELNNQSPTPTAIDCSKKSSRSPDNCVKFLGSDGSAINVDGAPKSNKASKNTIKVESDNVKGLEFALVPKTDKSYASEDDSKSAVMEVMDEFKRIRRSQNFSREDDADDKKCSIKPDKKYNLKVSHLQAKHNTKSSSSSGSEEIKSKKKFVKKQKVKPFKVETELAQNYSHGMEEFKNLTQRHQSEGPNGDEKPSHSSPKIQEFDCLPGLDSRSNLDLLFNKFRKPDLWRQSQDSMSEIGSAVLTCDDLEKSLNKSKIDEADDSEKPKVSGRKSAFELLKLLRQEQKTLRDAQNAENQISLFKVLEASEQNEASGSVSRDKTVNLTPNNVEVSIERKEAEVGGIMDQNLIDKIRILTERENPEMVENTREKCEKIPSEVSADSVVPSVGPGENCAIEDTLNEVIKSDVSICNDSHQSVISSSERRTSTSAEFEKVHLGDEDPELIEEDESLKSARESPCSFNSSTAWKTRGLGLINSCDMSIGSVLGSSVFSDKSYRPIKKKQSIEVVKEDVVEGSKRIRKAIAEEDVEDCTNDRVPFSSGAYREEQFEVTQFIESSTDAESETGLVDSIMAPKVLIHTKSGEFSNPCRDLSSTTFSKVILDNLDKMGVRSPNKIQSSIWPLIWRGGSTFAVAPPKSGKGLAILAPLCHQITSGILSSTPVSTGPILLVLCADIKSARHAQISCTSLLKDCTTSQGKPFGILRVDDCDDPQNVWKFFDNCEILITTPRCLDSYTRYQVNILNFDRVEYLLLNEVDILDERFGYETNHILSLVQKIAKERKTELKLFATSTTWCSLLKKIALESFNPSLAISSLHECAIYSGMELQVRFVTKDSKLEVLKCILNDSQLTLRRSVIICQDDLEVTNVAKSLKEDSHMILEAYASMTIDDLNAVRLSWHQCKTVIGNLILVCCDENLQFLNILNANWLVHFSLPKTFTKFTLRFSTMSAIYPSLYAEAGRMTKLKVDVFVDEENGTQLPKIIQFIKRYDIKIPEKVESLLLEILSLKDVRKADSHVPLCDRLLSFGECPDKWNCIERHSIVPAADAPPEWVPRAGMVTCKILFVHHSGLFSARLVDSADLDGTVKKIPQRNLRIALEMAAYFGKENRCHGPVQLGDTCAVRLDKAFERCQVVKIVRAKKRDLDFVLLNLLEEESYIWKNAFDLYFLPDYLKEFKSATVRIRSVGLKPIGGKECWSATSIRKLRSQFEKSEELFVKGKIALGIGNTLWLEHIQICRHLESLNLNIVKCNLKPFLLKEFAVENPSHLDNLKNLCKNFDFHLPVYSLSPKPAVYKQNLPTPQWAHLNDGFTNVYFSSALSPDLLFVRILSNQRSLDDLQADIQTYVEDLKRKFISLPCEITEDVIADDFYCLAKFPDDSLYYRVRVDQILDGNTYKCFFVDHGDWKNVAHDNMYPINSKLISRIPFQAIECRIFGIKPATNEWGDAETDFLYDSCFVDDSDELKVLLAKHYSKTPAEFTKGNKYGILLVDKDVKNTLSEMFLKNTMGEAVADELDLILGDKESIETALNDDECLLSDDELSESSNPIPDFILQQSVVPYQRRDSQETVDTDQLSEFNKLFSDFDVTEDDYGKWDCTFGDSDIETFKDSHNLPKMPKFLMDKEEPTQNRDTPKSDDFVVIDNVGAIQNDLYSKPSHKTPRVLWHQNDKFVIVKIQLADVNIYECSISVKSFYFQTSLDGDAYVVQFDLYGGVVPDKSSHASKGSYVFVKLRKMTQIEWKRLPVESYKGKHCVYDHDFIYFDERDSDVEREEERIRQGLKSHAEDLMNDDYDDGKDVDEDDIFKSLPMIDTDSINRELLRKLCEANSDDEL